MTRPAACDLLTIGHSNLTADRFVALLKDAGVTAGGDADLFRDRAERLAHAYRRRAQAVAARIKA